MVYIRYAGGDKVVQMAMELKVWRDDRPDPVSEGLRQLDDYMSGLGLKGNDIDRGWLVIFDQRSHQPAISERTSAERADTPAGRSVMLIRA